MAWTSGVDTGAPRAARFSPQDLIRVWTDLRYAVRRLRHSPGFSTVALATIALAVGANAAMFSLVYGMFLRPLPYPDADRIVRVLERRPTGGINAVSTLNYLDWANENTVFDAVAAEAGWRATLTGGTEPLFIQGALVSPRYFEIFGVTPAQGRAFAPGEDEPGRDRVVLVSHRLWERRFGADPNLVGQPILLDAEPHTVIGILPGGGPFDRAAAQVWKPLAFPAAGRTRDYRWLGTTARLKPGVTLEQARAGMDVVAQRIAAAHPQSNEGWGVAVDRLGDVLIGPQLRTALTVLVAATAFVLLIGCANLANLALARGLARHGEMAVRAALGARRRRLVWELLTENLVIAVGGGVAGVGVGYLMLGWIISWIPPHSLPPAVDVRMDAMVLLFALAIAAGAGLLFGIAPAVQASGNLAGALRQSRTGTTAIRPGRRLHGVLVAAEIALAFVLLVASALLMRSFVNLLDVDPGFQVAGVLTAGLPQAADAHHDPDRLNVYLDSISAAVAAVPGVRRVALTSALPLEGGGYGVPYRVADRPVADHANRRRAFFRMVSPSYVDALGIRLLAGRALTDADTAAGPPVALINETLAQRDFPNEDPIGRRLLAPRMVPGTMALGPDVGWEIVGVIAGEKVTGLGDPISPAIYVSIRQQPTADVHLIVRADLPPALLQLPLRSAVDRVNRGQALSDVRTLEYIVQQSTAGNRVAGTLLTVFAAVAVLLAAVGIYGVLAFSARQRAHELGIRAALGAGAWHLRWLIVRDGMRPAMIGLLIGLMGTAGATQVMASMLYGVESDDPLTIAVVAALLASVAGLACVLPVWRVATADPLECLRSR
jgi:putative ABC transport system permease protein